MKFKNVAALFMLVLSIAAFLGVQVWFGRTGEAAESTEAVEVGQVKKSLWITLKSPYAVMIELETGKELYGKKSSEKMYPASMTKIMTAIVALENLEDKKELVTLSDEMFQIIRNENAVTAGFESYEEVPAIELLYGLMMMSGAECAIGLAEHVSGSEEAFVELMNEKALKLGMENTHFVNTTGLHDDNHYSTASDIATLLRYALTNETFYDLITTSVHSTVGTDAHPGGVTFRSTLFANLAIQSLNNGVVLGGKTGFTDEAGQCLASFAEMDGKRLIMVTGGANTRMEYIDDAYRAYGAVKTVQ
ncbi:MAG: D-alanyl-D-alanine carboxypeptidase [Clostridiales bacterium]|jgi:D-alanyl-D-alanine carboxypeptidase (penicillin-binding protein 5/6)|nr:D-alanyl-D-alanine carboxypeptidase [Clostridiales bacterium]